MGPPAADKLVEFYENYLTDSSTQLVAKTDLGASHAVVSDHAGTNCGHSDNELYIENCDYNR